MKMKKAVKLIGVILTLFCLLAVSGIAAEVKPGLNIFTGTESPYTFDGDEADISDFYSSGVSVVTYPNDNSGNKALAYTALHQFFAVKDFPETEAARPFKVSIDVDYSGQIRFMAVDEYDSALLNCADAIVIYGKPAGALNNYSYTIKGTQTASAGTGDYFNDNYTGKPFENLLIYMFSNIAGKEPTYVDDISVIPYYAVHYDLNGGTGIADPEFFYAAAGTQYTITEDGSSILRPGYSFAGWAKTPDATAADVVTSVDVVLGQDTTLYAVWVVDEDDTKKMVELYDGETLREFYVVTEGTNRVIPEFEVNGNTLLEGWQTADGNTIYGFNIPSVNDHLKLYSVWEEMETKPGINVFENGSFEQDGIIDVRASNGRLSIVTDTDGNKMLEYERGSGYASIQHYVKWEHGRKYRVEYRFKADYSASTAVNMRYDSAANHLSGQAVVEANTWYSYATDYTYNNEDHTPDIYDGINIYYNPNSANSGGTVYYDDLVFTPYYKVSYHGGGGTGVPDDEFTLADTYVIPEVTPVRPGFRFMGWSLKNGSVTTVTEVTMTPGEDVNLYAVWESLATDEAIVYDFTSEVPGVANGSIYVFCPEEVAAYTSVEVYLADNDGVMEGYTPFAVMEISDAMAAYSVSGNRAFDRGATRLAFVFKADGLDDITYWYTIPEEHRFDVSEHTLEMSFWASSDTHLCGTDYWPQMRVNRNNAMKDMFASDADMIFINGDVVNYGTEAYVAVLEKHLEEVIYNPEVNTKNIPVLLSNGNHEYMNTNNANGGFEFDPVQAAFIEHLEHVIAEYPEITVTYDGESLWYAADLKGVKFIFLSSPEETSEGSNTHTYTVSAEQLKFLEDQLFESEQSNKTAVVVSHVPLKETYKQNGVWESGITNSDDIKKILALHPNTLFCSGHTHSELGNDKQHYVGVGDMTTTFSHLNDGCLVWISADDMIGEDGSGHIKSYSTAMYVEVYNDMIMVRSRKFLENSLYFGHSMYIIPTPDRDVEVAKAEIAGTPADGATLEAVIDNPESYTYEWIVAGEVVSTDRVWEIDAKSEFGGQYVYLRAIDENGYYATAKSAKPFAGFTVTYDLNGGTGALPMSETVLDGYYICDDTTYPTKEGGFFVGWSTDKNAVKPMATVKLSGDTTLYAVYSSEPKFYFDANHSGFKSNGVAKTTSIVDGNLVTVSPAGDQYYTWTSGSFAAADYPFMRIKKKSDTVNDGVFFKSDAGGFAESRHLLFSLGTVVAELDGYEVYEFDILNIPEEKDSWYGTISALRYDVTIYEGTTYTDYLVFTDKRGIYKADLTLEKGADYAALSSDSVNVSVAEVTWNGNIAKIVLIPSDGYEFTTEEDVMAYATVNGEKISGAEIDNAGYATVTYAFEQSVSIGSEDENADVVSLEFNESIGASTVIVAAYDADDRFIAAYVGDLDAVSTLKVYINSSLEASYVKAFALGSKTALNPITDMVKKEIAQ